MWKLLIVLACLAPLTGQATSAGAKAGKVIGCKSEKAVRDWVKDGPTVRHKLLKTIACLEIPETWKIVQSDERNKKFSLVIVQKENGDSMRIWTTERFGDD